MAQVLSSVVVSAVKDSQIRAAMDDQIATYLNDAGACERIQKTCIPYCYTRHTSREALAHCFCSNLHYEA